jgi:hypothetical protein
VKTYEETGTGSERLQRTRFDRFAARFEAHDGDGGVSVAHVRLIQ